LQFYVFFQLFVVDFGMSGSSSVGDSWRGSVSWWSYIRPTIPIRPKFKSWK